MSNIELNGEWWLPNSEKRITGILSFSDNQGINLVLNGFLDDNNFFENLLKEDVSYPIIHGKTKDKDLTLFDCMRCSASGGTNYPSSEYSICYVFEGGHFNKDIEEQLFSRIAVNFSYSSQWGTLSKIESLDNKNFCIKPHKDIKVDLDKASLIIHQISKCKLSHHTISIELGSLIDIIFERPISFPEIYNQYLVPLKFFITLMTTEFNQIVSVKYYQNPNSSLNQSFSIFCRAFKNNEIIEDLHPRKMYFSLDEIKQNLQSIVNKWFELYHEIHDIINLYFSVEENSKFLYLENRFLFIAQFLEGYYKRVINQNKTSLSKIIKYYFEEPPNSFILYEISRALSDFNHDSNISNIKAIKKRLINQISKDIEITRNYHSHYGHSYENKLKGNKLFRVTQIMDFLSKSILLNRLGLPNVNEKIHNSEFKYFLANAKSFELLS